MYSDNEDEEIPSWRGVPGSIILINLFDPSNRNTAAVALDATRLMVRQYLRMSNSYHVGVCLYGVDDSNSSTFGIKNVTDIFPLTIPTLDDFKKLRSTDFSTYCQAKELKLSDALWHCNKMFLNCKKQLSSRSIFILTRLDIAPIQSDEKPTLKRVTDLVDLNIDIKIINVSEQDYEVNHFYKKFIAEANKGKESDLPKPIWDHKKIEEIIHQQLHRHLAVARLCFEIGDGLSIGVGVYNLMKMTEHNHYKKTTLDVESNAIVTSVTKTVKVSTEQMDIDEESEPRQLPLLKSELLYYQEYGGQRVEFTDKEMKVLRNPFGPPSIKLLGFKPAILLCKEKWYLKMGYFLFPNESIIEGSIIAFKALHKACVDTSMIAICILCTRINSKPKVVALSPCTSPLGLDIEIGFDVINIPFIENVREVPILEEEEEGEEQISSNAQKNLFKDILKSLEFHYTPNMFENPKLQTQYRAIEAKALEDDDVEPFTDTTRRDTGDVLDRFNEQFEKIFGPFTLKRAGVTNEASTSNKRINNENIDESILQSRIAGKQLAQYTVLQLKDILKSKNIPQMPALTGLKKTELIQLVYDHFK